MKPLIIGGVIGLVLLVAGFLWVTGSAKPSLASISTGDAPWPVETMYLKNRLAAIGLPALASEGSALHTHQQISVYVHGIRMTVPSGIGIHESAPAFISPIHTHDETGIIHVESPTVERFTLGQFFDIWGVRLDAACVGGYCTEGENTLTIFVQGEPYTGDPRDLELTPHEVIVVAYGTPAELPHPIPSTYTFPSGY